MRKPLKGGAYQNAFPMSEKPIKAFICPYCRMPLDEEINACCGEANEGIYIYLNSVGEEIENEEQILSVDSWVD